MLMPVDESQEHATESTRLFEESDGKEKEVMVADFQSHLQKLNWTGRIKSRATMLFLMVICLKLSDILFAVDSVSATVSAVNDLFLAYTSTVFAMRGLRATFFFLDLLVKLFSLLKYGVGIILAVVCFKLIIGHRHYIPTSIIVVVVFRLHLELYCAALSEERSDLVFDV